MALFLIIEDTDYVLNALCTMVEAFGHHYLAATSAEEALEVSLDQPADEPIRLIICDFSLPDIDGIRLMYLLTHHFGFSEDQIIMISGYDREKIGFSGPHFLRKPVDLDTFSDLIDELLAA